MDGPLDEVVARLKAAIEKLDTAVITATRAQADAQQAETHYREAGYGSDHSAIKRAITGSTTAADKAGKVGRLLAETSAHLTAYVNTIAPGTIQPSHSAESAVPSGEELVADTVKRSNVSPGIESYLARLTRKADDVQDQAERATDAVQTFIQTLRSRHGPALEMEGLIRAVLGEPELMDNISADTMLGAQTFLLGTLLEDEDMTEPQLEAFIAEVEQTAARYM